MGKNNRAERLARTKRQAKIEAIEKLLGFKDKIDIVKNLTDSIKKIKRS